VNVTSVASRTAAALVAAVAGFASYRHIVDVAREAGEHRDVAAVLPLAIDGLILVATLAMLDDKRNGRRPRLSARSALVFGIVATIAANVASAQPDVTARLVAAVPAVSFLLAVEVLSRTGKRLPDVDPGPTVAVTPAGVETWLDEQTAEPAPVDPWDYAEPIGPPRPPVSVEPVATDPARVARRPLPEPVGAPVHGRQCFCELCDQIREALVDPLDEPAPVASPPDVPDVKPPATRPRPKSLTSAEKVARAAAKLPDGTLAQIAAKAGVSESTVRRYLPPRTPAPVPSPSGPDAAETAPAEQLNGHDLVEVAR
jgi:hypothetical protein